MTKSIMQVWSYVVRYRKLICKVFLYLLLLIIYINFYLIDEILNYAKGSKTVSSQTIEVDFLQSPYITLCFTPIFKPSIVQNYGFPDNDDVRFMDVTSWNMYQNLSYHYEKDFNIRLETKSSWQGHKQKITFEIQRIATFRHGLCYLIKANESLSTKYGRNRLFFNYIGLAKDIPKRVTIFFVSPYNWHGIVADDWPQSNPFKAAFEIPLKMEHTRTWVAKVSQIDHDYMEGVENFENCLIEQIAKNSNCSTACYPILYNFLPDYRPCNTTEEFDCILHLLMAWRQLRYDCLRAKKSIQYNANFFHGNRRINGTGFVFVYYFDKATKDVKEEVWIVTTGGFIGSVGGSLGLFLGFSCFTYLSIWYH